MIKKMVSNNKKRTPKKVSCMNLHNELMIWSEPKASVGPTVVLPHQISCFISFNSFNSLQYSVVMNDCNHPRRNNKAGKAPNNESDKIAQERIRSMLLVSEDVSYSTIPIPVVVIVRCESLSILFLYQCVFCVGPETH